MTRAFTLLEAMVVVAILGIVAALGVPNLIELIHKNRLTSTADTAASFIDGARRHAFAVGRCTRIIDNGAGLLIMQTRTSGDCADLDDTAWSDTDKLKADDASIAFALQSLTTAAAPANNFRIVFRPAGRLVGDGDLDTSEDGARIVITDTDVATASRVVLVTANGRICSLADSKPPPALAAPVRCP